MILLIVWQKRSMTLGFTCNKYTAKHDELTQLMILLENFILAKPNNKSNEDSITKGLTYT